MSDQQTVSGAVAEVAAAPKHPCCRHCEHDPGYEHANPCLVCGQPSPVVITVAGVEWELS